MLLYLTSSILNSNLTLNLTPYYSSREKSETQKLSLCLHHEPNQVQESHSKEDKVDHKE